MSKLTNFNNAAMSADAQSKTEGALFGWLWGYRSYGYGGYRRSYGYGGYGYGRGYGHCW